MAVWIVAFSLILARVATFVSILPLLGGRDVPRSVKVALALALTISWFDFSTLPSREIFAQSVDLSWIGYGAALLREALLGAMLGYALGLFLAPLKVAGEFITQQMGLSLGAIVDPTSNSSSGAITQTFEMLGILLFFGLDGHHVFLTVLHSTLTRVPVGTTFGMIPVEGFIAGGAATEEWGLMLVAPISACLFLTTIVLALMTRATPQMNIFSVGFALQIGVGLTAIFFLMPDLLLAVITMFGRVGELLTRLVEGMAEDFDDSKSEAPTMRRREEARQQGQVAISAELMAGTLLLTGVVVLWMTGPRMADGLFNAVQQSLLLIRYTDLEPERVQEVMGALVARAGQLLAYLLGWLFVVALGVGILQVGFHIVPDLLLPKWEKLSPAEGWSRLFSMAAVVRALVSLLKLAAVALLAYWVLRGRIGRIATLGEGNLSYAVAQTWDIAIRLALAIAAVLALIGVIDYAYQRFRFERSLRMSRQDLKEELKREEGDPQMKGRIRKMQREAARRRMMHEVPRATVVITNPLHLAVALRYERGEMAAPRLVAKGAGFVAQRIVELAREHDVPVLERKATAQALFKAVQVGQDIPEGLYLAVAEILAYIYRLRSVHS